MNRIVPLALALLSCGGLATACSKPTEEATPAGGPQVVVPTPSHSVELHANAPVPSAKPADPNVHKHHARVVVEEIGVPSAPSEVNVHFKIPHGTAVNDEAPFRIRWKSSEALENAPDDVAAKGAGHGNGFRIALRPAHGAKVARLLGEVELVVCDSETHSVCIPVKREVDLTFTVGGKAAPKPVELALPSANG